MLCGTGRSRPVIDGPVADRTASSAVGLQGWGPVQWELYELLIEDRTALIDRWRDKVRLRRFLDELAERPSVGRREVCDC